MTGFVELVTESETLRKIQIKHGRGVAGSFKDTTIREWLQLQNPTELEYEKVRTARACDVMCDVVTSRRSASGCSSRIPSSDFF